MTSTSPCPTAEWYRCWAPAAAAKALSCGPSLGSSAWSKGRSYGTATRWTIPAAPDGLDEATPLAFESPYGCSKGAADQYFLDYHRIYGTYGTNYWRHNQSTDRWGIRNKDNAYWVSWTANGPN